VPEGEGHIFELVRDKKTGNLDLPPRSLCGKGVTDVGGPDRMIMAERVQTLPICPDCLNVWKTDPNGPFAKWIAAAKR
jgi:hypothetical protein